MKDCCTPQGRKGPVRRLVDRLVSAVIVLLLAAGILFTLIRTQGG